MSYSNLCRGCMNLTNINPINSLLESAFKDIFEKCTGLQIAEEDSLPKVLCNECNMKCNQWKQFKQQCENSCFQLQNMINKKDIHIEFMDVGVIKEEDSDDEKFDTTNCDFDDGNHSSDSDEKEKLAEIISELNPVCEIKEEVVIQNNELRNLNLKLKKYPKRVHNTNLILPPMKMTVKKTTDLSGLDLEDPDEFNTISKTENSSVAPRKEEPSEASELRKEEPSEASEPRKEEAPPQPTRHSFPKRKSTKKSYADDDDDDDDSSGNDDESDNDTTYRKRPTFIYKCKTCRKRFTGLNLYEVHYVTVHMTNKEVTICRICGEKFGRESNIIFHLRRKHVPCINEAKFNCEICNRGFMKTNHLERHMKSHRSFKCDQCDRSFSQQTKLNTHILTHVTERLFICTICDKSYKTQLSLRNHKEIHEKDKSFCCTECGKLFLKLSTLKKHMYSHTQERPFKCAECPKDYKSSNMLRHHMKVHSVDTKLISCEFCSRTFRDRKVYSHHRMTHTGERPHTCTFCNRGFIQRTAWKTHMKTHVAE